jgi:hypothetical protein
MDYVIKPPPKNPANLLEQLFISLQNHFDSITVRSVPDQGITNHFVEVVFSKKDENKVHLSWEIQTNQNSFFNKIKIIAPNGENEDQWKEAVISVIKDAISKSNASKAKLKISTRHFFGYIGPVLDGKYVFEDFFITPGSLQNLLLGGCPSNVEQVLCLHLVTEGDAINLIHENARIKAKQLASLLSVFLGVGLYEIYHYDIDNNFKYSINNNHFRWAWVKRDDKYICESVQLGYADDEQDSDVALGTFREIDRNKVEYVYYKQGEKLKCPQDIQILLSSVNELSEKNKKQFYNATALMQFAELQKNNFPSVALSYAVASIDAMTYKMKIKSKNEKDSNSIFSLILHCFKPNRKTNLKRKIQIFINRCYPGIDRGIIDALYKDIRCAHFHEGVFPAGEFKMRSMNPFASIDNSDLARALSGYEILRSTLIKWILINK